MPVKVRTYRKFGYLKTVALFIENRNNMNFEILFQGILGFS
jgi:hypothetical protein